MIQFNFLTKNIFSKMVFVVAVVGILMNIVAIDDSWAQGALEREHPRVSELQDKLTDYARGYLQTRLQGVPFMVTVKIEPLRRQGANNFQAPNEKLPYYDLQEEEIRDEWDDPSASIYVLQSRIQKATILLNLPQALKDYEVQEIRDALMSLLRLIPGRDEIKIEQRSWSLGATFWNYVILASAILFCLLIGLIFISRSWAKKLAGAIHDIKPKDRPDGDSGSSAPIVTSGGGSGAAGGGGSGGSGGGDLKFRDPLKTREFVHSRLAELIQDPTFPTLQAMIEMDRLAERLPKDFGALMMEFPPEKQKEIFAMSFKPEWLDAFTSPGELTGESLELLDRLTRMQVISLGKDWENMIIQVWRLGDEKGKFIKSLTKDEALAVLKSMPISVAVPVARQVFPGAWAVLLDPTFKPIALTPGRIKEIYWYALEMKVLLDFSALERYRQERDLLDYLVVSTVPEEKDIYGALPADSFLWKVRPPFYQVFDSGPDILKGVFSRVTLDDWALALFNVSRDYRKPIEALFNSKQKYLFANKMRTIEGAGFDRRIMGQARERIAKIHSSTIAELNRAKNLGTEEVAEAKVEDASEPSSDDNSAA
jgi:hypothetical protein